MPTYKYKCKKCKKVFESRHSMSLDAENCNDLPDSDCGQEGEVEKDYSSPITTKGVRKIEEKERREYGEIVEEAIEDNRNQLNKKKEKMRKEEYNPENK